MLLLARAPDSVLVSNQQRSFTTALARSILCPKENLPVCPPEIGLRPNWRQKQVAGTNDRAMPHLILTLAQVVCYLRKWHNIEATIRVGRLTTASAPAEACSSKSYKLSLGWNNGTEILPMWDRCDVDNIMMLYQCPAQGS